ncbi:MAG: hypothetical protein ACYDAD_14105 [Acidimicrobiales bacterium]
MMVPRVNSNRESMHDGFEELPRRSWRAHGQASRPLRPAAHPDRPPREAAPRRGLRPATDPATEASSGPVWAVAARHGALAGVVAALLLWLGPHGGDLAAHAYQRSLFMHSGFTLWNNFWYAGQYSFITYSILYYPLAAVLGIPLLAVLSLAAGAVGFTLVVTQRWGESARWPARVFAFVWGVTVLSGAFPYALGMALVLFSIRALQRRRSRLFAVLVPLVLAASPLALVFLIVMVFSAGVAELLVRKPFSASSRRLWFYCGAVLVGTASLGLLLRRLFPDPGRYSFPFVELVYVGTFCAIGAAFTWRLNQARMLRVFFVVYALACTAAFVLPSAIGSNLVRLRMAALPIGVLVLGLRRWYPRVPSLLALALVGFWNFTPAVGAFAADDAAPSAHSEYWQPAESYLRSHLAPGYRVEAVDSVGHWAAAYLPQAGIPLVRGWFRQDDFPQNQLLYGDLTPESYLRWLHQMSVAYVVLSGAPPDYSSRSEAELLRSGQSGLRPVMFSANQIVYAVPSPTPLVTGPGAATVRDMTESGLAVDLDRPGLYRVAIRYSAYWRTSEGCLTRAPDGMMELMAPLPGTVSLAMRVGPAKLVGALLGQSGLSCATSPQ